MVTHIVVVRPTIENRFCILLLPDLCNCSFKPSIAPQQLVSAGYFVDIALTNPAILLSIGIDH
jgi:hypothetical protein